MKYRIIMIKDVFDADCRINWSSDYSDINWAYELLNKLNTTYSTISEYRNSRFFIVEEVGE